MATSGPEDYEALRRRIIERYDDLSKQLKVIAGYTLRHPDDVALENSYVVAARAGVQPSAMVRFAQAFGCEGYTELQAIFRSRIRERALSLPPVSGEQAVSAGGSIGEIQLTLRNLSRVSMNALERLDSVANVERIVAAAKLIIEADTIFLLAQRRSFAIAVYLQYLLSQLGLRVTLLDGIGGLLFEQAASVRQGDLIVAVSFHTYAPDVVQLVREFSKKEIPIVAVTDGPLSPLASIGKVVFQIEDASVDGFQPITATACLALALVAGTVAVKQKRDAEGRLAEAGSDRQEEAP